MVNIGLMTIRIDLPGSESLKDKRMVVRSLMTKIRDKHNVSAAEVDDLDLRQRATLVFAAVSNDTLHNDRMLERVLHAIECEPRCSVLSVEREAL